jgi:uncharacterized protein (TIRG00374 family)
LLYFTLRGLDWSAFFDSLRRANYMYVALMLLWSTATYFLRAMRWRVLLNSQKHLSPLTVFWANMAGYLGNTILPARAGELVRAAYISRREKIPVAFVLATGITERLVDLAALVLIGAGSLFFAEAFPKSVQEALRNFSIVAVLGVAFIFLLPLFQGWAIRILFALPFLKTPLKEKLAEMIRHFVDGIKVIARLERAVPFLLFTALIWLMDGVGTILFARSLHETLTLAQSFLFIAALGISSAIPSTPGYVGVYQFVAVTVLVPFGFARESALALILLVQFLNLLIVSGWGGLGLWVGSREYLADPEKNVDGEKHG